jgi:hypothetical protein
MKTAKAGNAGFADNSIVLGGLGVLGARLTTLDVMIVPRA